LVSAFAAPGFAGRCAACETVFDPDLEQRGNTSIMARRDPATGDLTRILAHCWRRPRPPVGRQPRQFATGRRLREHKALGAPQGSPSCPTPGSNLLGSHVHFQAMLAVLPEPD
jgi:hypothetical protein